MRRLTTSLIILIRLSFFSLTFFLLIPSMPVEAVFNDTVDQTLGIKLELGTVSITAKDTTIVKSAEFTEGNSVKLASFKLVNNGSLTSKLVYKIDVTKEDKSIPTTKELKNTVISIDFGKVANKVDATGANLNSNSFSFAEQTDNDSVMIEPNSIGEIPVIVSYKGSNPSKNEKLKIKVTFKLVQSNESDPNADFFSSEIEVKNDIALVPKVVEEKNYWPDKSTFINVEGKLSYSLEKMNMVFSEVYDASNSNIKNIKNLNEAVLYIQLPKDVPLKTDEKETGKKIDSFKVLSMVADDSGKINVEKTEIDEINHGIKITFNLEDSYDSFDPNKVREYTNKYRYPINIRFQLGIYTFNGGTYGSYTYYSGIYDQRDIFASRLVLSSDIPSELNEAKFEQKKIYLSDMKKAIVVKQIKTLSYDSVKNDEFKDVQLSNEIVELEIIQRSYNQISYSMISNNTFSLWLNSSEVFNDAKLNVKITGDTGNTLVISRKLENSSQSQTTSIKSIKIPLINKETEEQINQQSDTAKTIEEPDSTIDSTVPNEPTTEVPIEDAPQEDVDDGDEEIIDSSSIDSDSEIKEETVPIENSDQSIPEEVRDD